MVTTNRGPNSYAAVLARYDAMDPLEAIVAAWMIEGPNPDYHRSCRAEVRRLMPLLAHSIDRAVIACAITTGERAKARS